MIVPQILNSSVQYQHGLTALRSVCWSVCV